jgi:hypothetical protein
MRIGGFRFFFYSNEGLEPVHIHVQSGDGEAKFWLNPVALERSYGFNSTQIRQIERHIRDNLAYLIEAWNEFFGRDE